MAKSYEAADIEVLSGLDPVRRRPGMYTDTSRPNHLAHEVIDNSVDEAIALGTRVVVLSPRPGRIVLDEPVPFAAQGISTTESRDLPEFARLRRQVSAAITSTEDGR